MKAKQIHGVENCDQHLALQIGESVLWNRLGFLLESTGGSNFNPVASTAAIFSREFADQQMEERVDLLEMGESQPNEIKDEENKLQEEKGLKKQFIQKTEKDSKSKWVFSLLLLTSYS